MCLCAYFIACFWALKRAHTHTHTQSHLTHRNLRCAALPNCRTKWQTKAPHIFPRERERKKRKAERGWKIRENCVAAAAIKVYKLLQLCSSNQIEQHDKPFQAAFPGKWQYVLQERETTSSLTNLQFSLSLSGCDIRKQKLRLSCQSAQQPKKEREWDREWAAVFYGRENAQIRSHCAAEMAQLILLHVQQSNIKRAEK